MSCTLTGTFLNPDGSVVANGTLVLTLSQNAVQSGTGQVVPQRVSILLTAGGAIPGGTTIIGNDSLQPPGTSYNAQIVTVGFVYYQLGAYVITGGTFDFDTATPTAGGVTYPLAVVQVPAAPQSITGQPLTLTATAPLTVAILNRVTVYSDQVTGTDWSTRVNTAINLLPASGGIVDSRNDFDGVTGGSSIINPGSKDVTILLGPNTYYVGNATSNAYLQLQPNLRIIGSGKFATTITTLSTTQAPFISSTTATMTSVELRDFSLNAPVGSAATQNGIWLSINPNNEGMWYSLWESINIINFGGVQLFFDGSGGGDGATAGVGDHQFNSLINVNAYRKNVAAWISGHSYVAGNTVTINSGACVLYSGATAYTPGKMVWYGTNGLIYVCIANSTGNVPTNVSFWSPLTQLASAQTYVCTNATPSAIPGTSGGASFWSPYHSEALYIHGASGQNTFVNCEMGNSFGAPNSGINISLDCVSSPNFNVNYSNKFFKLTCQFAALGIHVTGGITIDFDSLHAEALYGVVLADYDNSIGIGITGLRITYAHMLTGCGVNGGAGYIGSLTSATTNTGLNVNQAGDFTLTGCNIFGTPDNLVMANGSFQTIVRENSSASNGSTIGKTSGLMPTIAAATTVDCGRAKVVAINGGTTITGILSILQPGEMITFFALNGTINFATGGNLKLGSGTTQAVLQFGTATFMCYDSTSLTSLVQNFALVSVAT